MKLSLIILVTFINLSAFAGEILWNSEKQRSVLDLYTDPNSKIWEQYPSLYELCYKNATASEAHDELLFLKEEGILFHDWQTENYQESSVDGQWIDILVYNEKMLDDGIDEDEAYEEISIGPCEF